MNQVDRGGRRRKRRKRIVCVVGSGSMRESDVFRVGVGGGMSMSLSGFTAHSPSS